MVPVLVMALLSAPPRVGEPTVSEIAAAAYEAPHTEETASVLLRLAALAVETEPGEAVEALARGVGGLKTLTNSQRQMIALVLTRLGAPVPDDLATGGEWIAQVVPSAIGALMRVDAPEAIALAAALGIPEADVVELMADAALAMAAAAPPHPGADPGSVRPIGANAPADPLADLDRLSELALDLAADLSELDAVASGLASAVADTLMDEPGQGPELALTEAAALRRERAAELAQDLVQLVMQIGDPELTARASLLSDLLAAPPTEPASPRGYGPSPASRAVSGVISPADLASEAKARLTVLRSPAPELVEKVVEAVFAADPEQARHLIYEVGPTREPACAALCMRAETPGQALEAASGIAAVERRARVLLDSAEASNRPEFRRQVVREAIALAELVSSPSEQARILARAAALGDVGTDPVIVAEKACFAAMSTPDFQARARTLAEVAALIAPVAPDLAEECFDDAEELAATGLRDAERARLLRDVAVAGAPGLPHRALAIAQSLGSGRLRSQIDVLLAVTASPYEAYQVEAANRLLSLVASWDTAPRQKMDLLVEVATSLASAPAERTRAEATLSVALPSLPAGIAVLLVARPVIVLPDEPPQGQDARKQGTGRGVPPRLVSTTKAPESPGLPESPSRALPRPGSLEEARLRVEWWISRLSLERAHALPSGEGRISAFLGAADRLSGLDAVLALEALAGALQEAALYDCELGWAERAYDLATSRKLDYVQAVGALKSPKARARSLIAARMPAEEAIAQVDDAWARAELRVHVVQTAPTPEAIEQALVALRVLPPGTLRDDLVLRLLVAVRGPSLEAFQSVAERLALLASKPAVAARVRLVGAQEAASADALDVASEWRSMAEELIVQSGRDPMLDAELAIVLDLLGEDGLGVARAIDSPGARARALLAIRCNRDARAA